MTGKQMRNRGAADLMSSPSPNDAIAAVAISSSTTPLSAGKRRLPTNIEDSSDIQRSVDMIESLLQQRLEHATMFLNAKDKKAFIRGRDRVTLTVSNAHMM
jgi:hypothetical protein